MHKDYRKSKKNKDEFWTEDLNIDIQGLNKIGSSLF